MRNLSSFITSALVIGALIGTTAYVWFKTRDDEEEEESNSGSCIDILESSEDETVDVTKDNKEEKEEKSPL